MKPLYKAGDRSVIKDDEKFPAFAEAHAHSTLTQMSQAWEGKASIFALSRKLKKLGITRKKERSATKSVTRPSAKNS
ncbi:MAG: hypothetical protein ABW189_06625 [Rickettsiales bacterium]